MEAAGIAHYKLQFREKLEIQKFADATVVRILV